MKLWRGVSRSEAATPFFRRWVVPVAFLVGYASLLLFDLERFPEINPDEAGYAEPAWTLITRGEFGAPMYAGMFGMEHRIYTNWPGRGVTTVLPYFIFGPTLFAARLASVAMAILLAVLASVLVRRLIGRHLRALDWGVLGASLFSPVVFGAGRFARPEIDVAAWTLAMLICLDVAFRARLGTRSRWWLIAAGASDGFAFVMHQYGLITLLSGTMLILALSEKSFHERVKNLLWMLSGTIVAISPWVMFILGDIDEFRTQFRAAVENQAWRYPAGALSRTIVNEIPGRYLLNRQDYDPDWSPWTEVVGQLIPSVSVSEDWWPLRLLVRMARRPFELDAMLLQRTWWLGVAFALGVAVVFGVVRRGSDARARLVIVPTLAWVGALALIPNKWVGYTVTLTTLVGILGGVYLAGPPWGARHKEWLARGVVVVTLCLNARAIVQEWVRLPQSRQPIVDALHAAVPPGARVMIPFREWYVFAGRNPAIGIEGRSLPMFGTSLEASVSYSGVEYAVLARSATGEKSFYWVEASDPFVEAVTVRESLGRGVWTIRGVHPGEEFVIFDMAQGQADVGAVTSHK
jgi:hypothetical protein